MSMRKHGCYKSARRKDKIFHDLKVENTDEQLVQIIHYILKILEILCKLII